MGCVHRPTSKSKFRGEGQCTVDWTLLLPFHTFWLSKRFGQEYCIYMLKWFQPFVSHIWRDQICCFQLIQKEKTQAPDWSTNLELPIHFCCDKVEQRKSRRRKSDWRKEQSLLGIRDTDQMHTKDRAGKFLQRRRPNKFRGTWETENAY